MSELPATTAAQFEALEDGHYLGSCDTWTGYALKEGDSWRWDDEWTDADALVELGVTIVSRLVDERDFLQYILTPSGMIELYSAVVRIDKEGKNDE